MSNYVQLTPEAVLTYPHRYWKKVAPTRIRPITEVDIREIGPSFLDLEGCEQRVAIGRYLCVGAQGERWTCSSISDREPVSGPDSEGFIAYKQLCQRSVVCLDIRFPFFLIVHGKRWTSQPNGSVVTWNGQRGSQLDMRLIERSIFLLTYEPEAKKA